MIWNILRQCTFQEMELPGYEKVEREPLAELSKRQELTLGDLEDLKENFFLKNVTMEKVRKDMYYLAKNTEKYNDGVYALLRSTGVVPDDIFIPKDKKEKVEVIRRIRYLDTEAEIGEFLANIYLIKVINVELIM